MWVERRRKLSWNIQDCWVVFGEIVGVAQMALRRENRPLLFLFLPFTAWVVHLISVFLSIATLVLHCDDIACSPSDERGKLSLPVYGGCSVFNKYNR